MREKMQKTGYCVECSKAHESIYIDLNGNVKQLEHDTSLYAGGGYASYTEEDLKFREHVKSFMKNLLESDLKEFKQMRNVLKGEWYEMAESVRKDAISRFNF